MKGAGTVALGAMARSDCDDARGGAAVRVCSGCGGVGMEDESDGEGEGLRVGDKLFDCLCGCWFNCGLCGCKMTRKAPSPPSPPLLQRTTPMVQCTPVPKPPASTATAAATATDGVLKPVAGTSWPPPPPPTPPLSGPIATADRGHDGGPIATADRGHDGGPIATADRGHDGAVKDAVKQNGGETRALLSTQDARRGDAIGVSDDDDDEPRADAVVFILDWDDTLCASTACQRAQARQNDAILSALDAAGGSDTTQQATALQQPLQTLQPALQQPSPQVGDWQRLSTWVKLLLHQMLMCGPVYIVTNSQRGWVELSMQRYMPDLQPLLSRLTVMSARSMYAIPMQEQAMAEGKISEAELVEWKFRAFSHILFRHRHVQPFRPVDRMDRTAPWPIRDAPVLWKVPTVIALGDSMVELKALDRAAEMFALPVTKWVKFASQPSIQSLINQVQYVCSILPSIVLYKPSLRITLNPDIFTQPAQPTHPTQATPQTAGSPSVGPLGATSGQAPPPSADPFATTPLTASTAATTAVRASDSSQHAPKPHAAIGTFDGAAATTTDAAFLPMTSLFSAEPPISLTQFYAQTASF